MQIHNNNINPKSNLTAQSLTPTKNPELADMRKMQDYQKIGVLRRALNNIANAFRAIGESVTQANSGKPISMSISVKNLGIASNPAPARSEPLNDAGVENLKNHVTNLALDKKQALVDSAVKDVANGGHNLLKLLNRNPDLFKTVVDAGGEALLHAMDTHSAKIPTKLLSEVLSEVSDHMPKYIRDQCVTEGDYGALTADFDKGATKIAGFFEMGVMSLHEALESVKTLISSDIDGAMVKTGKDDMGEIFGGIREIVGTHGGAELRDGLAIRKQFEAMSRPGEIAGGVLDGLNSGGSLEDKEFRDSVNQALTAVGISLQFTGEEPNDTSVQKALKVISKQTGAGSGGDAMIFNRLTMPELKELKAMALLPDGQTQIEARLNSYSGATPEAATAIATACMKTFPLKPDQWVAVEELHEQLKTSSPQSLESEKVIQQDVKSMFPGGDKGLVKAFEANPALFGTLKDPMSKPVERCIRAFVSDPKNDISPQRAMSIFKALNEGNVSNGKPPTLSEIATDYALKTSESGDSIDFKKLSMTIDSLVRFGLDMDAVGETLLQSSRMGQDNLQPFTEDSAGYLLAAKAILSEHSSPETKRLMAISDSFKYLATKAGDEREFLEQFSVNTESEFLVKVKDSRLIDAAKQKGIKMPENVAEVDARRAELKTSVVTTLEISAALKSITVSSLSTIDGLISSPQDLTAQLRQQITLDAYAPADSALEHLATAKVSDIALAHLAKACIETTPKRIGTLKAETIGHMDTFRSQYNPEISTEEMVGFIQRGAELFQRIQSGTAPEHSSFHDVLSVSWFTTTSAMDNGQKVFEGSFRFADENGKVDAFLKGFQNNEARFGAGLPKSSTEPYQRFSTHYNKTSVSGETLWGSDKQMGIESYETRAMFPGGMNCLLWNQIQSPGSDKKEIFIKFEEKGLPYPGTKNLDKLFSNPNLSIGQKVGAVFRDLGRCFAHFTNFAHGRGETGKVTDTIWKEHTKTAPTLEKMFKDTMQSIAKNEGLPKEVRAEAKTHLAGLKDKTEFLGSMEAAMQSIADKIVESAEMPESKASELKTTILDTVQAFKLGFKAFMATGGHESQGLIRKGNEVHINPFAKAGASASAPASAPIEKPNVSKVALNKLVKQLDSRLNMFGGIVNARQKKFSPAEYTARKLDKLENLVTNIQKEVNADRLTWNKETQTLAIEMVSQKLEQYIGQLDRMSGSNPELKTELMKQASVLLDKIDKVIVPAAQFERLTPKGDISRIAAPTIYDGDATAPNSLEIGNKNYAIGELIGHGGSGNVYRCDGKENGEKGVVKVMLLTDSIGTLEALAEVYTSQQFAGHSHIMSPSSVAITELDENDMRYLALVMPEADQGDMENVVKKLADKPLAEQTPVFLKLLTDAADGLVEMHRKGFAHRDIKPGNIFVKTGLDSEPIGMLGDLGLAQDISKFDSLKMGGTEPYMPTDQKVSLSVDSYAFGMMAFQLLSGGSFPFLANKEDAYDGIFAPPAMPDTAVLRERIDARIPNASYAVKSLIKNSLSAVPADRPTMREWRDALSGPSAKGREEIAEMTAHIQRGNAEDMKTETDVVKLGADFFRAMPKMEVTLPGGLRIAGTDAGGAKAFLTKLFNQDSKISESTQAALAAMPLNDMNDMARIIRLIPKDAMTYSLIKMTNQSMLAELNGHMAQDFQGDVSAFSFERGSDRRINLDISDVNKPKVTVNQTYDYKTNPASETPDFSVSTSLSVQHDLGTGQVGSSVEFKSIHTPTANASLKAVQDHFKALGAIVG